MKSRKRQQQDKLYVLRYRLGTKGCYILHVFTQEARLKQALTEYVQYQKPRISHNEQYRLWNDITIQVIDLDNTPCTFTVDEYAENLLELDKSDRTKEFCKRY